MNIKLKLSHQVKQIRIIDQMVKIDFDIISNTESMYDKVIIATGGSPKKSGLIWLEELGHDIIDPVPSLFTFNMPGENIRDLMGIVVENTRIKIQSENLISEGPLLITHWGMSGPAILKLSAFGARRLSVMDYNFKIQVNWVNIKNSDEIKEEIVAITNLHPKKQLGKFSTI